MATETPAATLDEAWGHIPQTRESTAGVGSFTRTRVERIITLTTGLAFIAFGTQALLIALGTSQEGPVWHVALLVLVFTPLVAMVVACLVGRGVRLAAGAFAILYLVALVLWPIATAGTTADPDQAPWPWYLVNVATLAAVLAFPLALQIVWTVLVPVVFGFGRLIQGGFQADYLVGVLLDVSFALILGGLLLTLAWVFRAMAANVDATRARAVGSYAAAAATEAAEQERVAVAALMHDSVLAALIAADRADGPRAETLAVAMAREALTRLANTEQDASEGSDDPWTPASIAGHIESDALELGSDVVVARAITDDAVALPGRAARALSLAATQAVANAIEHAGGAGLAVTVHGTSEGVDVVVRDEGGGFDLDAVPDDRLGIRASIIARVAAVGGTVVIDSDPFGTKVRLTWRAAAS